MDALKNKGIAKPLFISTLAATGIPKLKIMSTHDTVFLRTSVNVHWIKEEIFKTTNKTNIKIDQSSTDN